MATDLTTDSGTAPHALTQVERVVDTFVAPAKTFNDIRRDASWWMPLLLMIVFSVASAFVVQHLVGFERVNENQIRNSPKQEEQLNQLTPEQRASRMAIGTKITAVITYAVPVLLIVGFAFYALILWASFNFILGAQTTYKQVFATCFYASLPYILLNILLIVTLYFGGNAEAYDYKNPVGTNLGYYLPDAAPWLRALLGRIDLIQLWTVGLVVYGMSIISKKTVTQSALVVLGWWCIVTLVTVAGAALTS